VFADFRVNLDPTHRILVRDAFSTNSSFNLFIYWQMLRKYPLIAC
jgi:hypothetical protein